MGEIGKTFNGLTGKTKDDFGHGEAGFVTYVNVFNNPIADFKMVENIETDNKQNQVEYGDIFFTTSSEIPEEVGMSSVWLGNQSNIYLNSFCFGYRPIIDIDLHYMSIMLRSSEVRRRFILLAQGISRYNISKTKAMDIAVPMPKIDEQISIGIFFKNINYLITLQQSKSISRKLILKTLFTIGISKNMKSFSTFDCIIPTNSWEQRKLGEVSKILAGGDVDKMKLKGVGKYPVIANALTNDGIIGYYDHSFRIEAPAVTVTGRGDVGFAKARKINFTPVVRLLALKSEMDIDFLENTINRQNILVESTGVPQLTVPQLGKYEVNVPIKDEQVSIGSFFSTLDTLITLQQCQPFFMKIILSKFIQKFFHHFSPNISKLI